ncbi:glycosyltransferase family 1 protein [Oceanicoccus sp. KOV_DT_Chl]|uniref:glycosyltransferase family 4 protein n=1 Tax=Oceanicoccus sp. KOV_DT_Chl TaxID=1904639 RepID=UPI000C7CA467|nr:glycosyltransferase family 1 protein [Oceanicoccus sp. KOV_DT_Chl]
MRSLKIAVDARPLAQPMVGITRYTYELLKRLTFNSPHQWYLYLDRPCIHSLELLPNVHIREGNCSANFVSSFFAQLVFPVWAHKDSIDVFWSPRHHLPLLLPNKVKKIVTIHDLVWKFYPHTMTILGRYLERLLMPCSIKSAAKVIAISGATAGSLKKELLVLPEKIVTIPLASYLQPVDAGGVVETGDAEYFLFVGTLEPRKNLDRILKAFSLALQRGLKVKELKIVGGSGWGGVDIADLVIEYGIDANVIVLGKVENEQLRSLYQNAYVLLMPSLYEGFGLPIIEAMSFGVPVVSSNVSSMPEVVGEGGLLVDPYSIDELVDAICLIDSDKDRYAQLSASAKSHAAHFSWDSTAAATLSAIEQLLE